MYSIPFYFADAQITDAFENLPIQNLYSASQKGTERWKPPFPIAQKENVSTKYPIFKNKTNRCAGSSEY